jgi:hypothetical protein
MSANKIFIGLVFFILSTLVGFAQTIPTITSVLPESGEVGSTVIIKGLNFSAIAAENIVYFGALKVLANTASTTELSVTVPSGATYMPIPLPLLD